MAWYDSNWSNRKKITIDSSVMSLSATVALPIYRASDTELANTAKSDGTDILFTQSDGETKLNHEIVSFNSGTGELLAYVGVPTSSSADVEIYMYYGYASASDQQDANALWNTGYTLHMEDDPSGGTISDSSGNNVDFTANGTWASGDSVTGKLGQGLSFHEADATYLSTANNSNAEVGTGDWSWIAWINPSGLGADNTFTNDQVLFAQREDDDNENYIRVRNVDYFQYVAKNSAASTFFLAQDLSNPFTNGSWQFIACRYDQSAGTFYVRRNGDSDVTGSGTHRNGALTADINIGARYTTAPVWHWEGDIDQVRFWPSTFVSDEYLDTIYAVENDPAGAITVDSEESEGTAENSFYFNQDGGMQMTRAIDKGTTDITEYVYIQRDDGTDYTGLVYNTASLACYYVRTGGTASSVSLVTQTVGGAHTDGGFVEVDSTNMPGVYRIDWPDAVFATGVDTAIGVLKGAANMKLVAVKYDLLDVIDSSNPISADIQKVLNGTTGLTAFSKMIQGGVSAEAASGTLSTTQMTTNLTETTDDHYNGRHVIWITGDLAGQESSISDYDGTSKMLTYDAVTEAPSDGDEFVIV